MSRSRSRHDPNDPRRGFRPRRFDDTEARRSTGRAAPRARTSGAFRCVHCGADVPAEAPGTAYRNHCPACLWSRHVDDDVPGDRDTDCYSAMEPIAITVRGDGEWALVHRCRGCGQLRTNRTAADDSALLLVRLALRPIAQPPFPLERLATLL